MLWVYSSVMLQRMVPNRFLGRVMSTDLGLATLTISLSTWVYGILAAAPAADTAAVDSAGPAADAPIDPAIVATLTAVRSWISR